MFIIQGQNSSWAPNLAPGFNPSLHIYQWNNGGDVRHLYSICHDKEHVKMLQHTQKGFCFSAHQAIVNKNTKGLFVPFFHQ